MRTGYISVLGGLFLTMAASPLSAQLKKVRFSTTGISISDLPFKVAQLKGFWREEGLDVEIDSHSWRRGNAGAFGRLRGLYVGFRLDDCRGGARSTGQARVHFIGQSLCSNWCPSLKSSLSRN